MDVTIQACKGRGRQGNKACKAVQAEIQIVTLEDSDLDRLYGLPLNEFVPERNALVERLQRAGAQAAADAAQQLNKPSVSAWAINQLSRHRGHLVVDLISAVDRLKAAQSGAADGYEDTPSLSEAVKDEEAALARIQETAPGILNEAGYVTSRATIDRAVRSIRAAAAHHEGRTLLERGRLSQDFEPTGFGELGRDPRQPPPRTEPRRHRDTVDLELETQRRDAVIKREEQAELRIREEGRRAEDEQRRNLQKKVDTAKRVLEAAREAETRLEREHNSTQRARHEVERRLRESVLLSEEAEARLGQAHEARVNAERHLAELKVK